MHTIILIAESRTRFIHTLQKHYRVQVVRSGKQAVVQAQAHNASVVVVDAVSLRTTGIRICQKLMADLPQTALIHICAESVESSPAQCVLYAPVTAHRLLDALRQHCLPQVPASTQNGSSETLIYGPFELDCARQQLIAHGQIWPLTPKQAALLAAFMQHPGETLSREWLMRHVWETTYTGDTRTLNVHIRWLRRVLEQGDGQPAAHYLHTVRGVGYRFELVAI